jgi:hypothetical protein
MTRLHQSLIALVVLTTGAACASAIPPVRLYGSPADLERLVGRWSGEYAGGRAGTRQGSIFFELAAGEDHAHGDVLMIPDDADHPFGPERGGSIAGDHRAAQYLSIRFVETEDGTIRGTLDPYWDPDRRCQASSTFRGRAVGDTVHGTFVTTYRDGTVDTTGTWSVRRVP